MEKMRRWLHLFSRYYYWLAILPPLLLAIIPSVSGETLYWGLPITQFVPWKMLAWEQMASGELPLWNPWNGMGSPLLANYQLAFFYPLGWVQFLFAALGGITSLAWSFLPLNALHLSLASLGMLLFLKALGISRFGQLIGAIAFSMSGYFVARLGTASMIWTGAWLPWVMLGTTRFAYWAQGDFEESIPWIGLVSITFQLLAGHAQLAWYSLVLANVWIVFLLWQGADVKRLMKGLFAYWGMMLVAVGLAFVQLLPTLELLMQSQRSGAVDFETGLTYSFWPWRLLSFVSPDFFGNPGDGTYFGYASYWEDAVYLGMIPLIFALIAVWKWLTNRKRNDQHNPSMRMVAFFGITILVGVVFALGKNLPIYPLLYAYVPTFDMFNAPARYMIWVVFSVAVLAGYGASGWKRPTGRALKRLRRITVGVAAVFLGAGVVWIALSHVRVTFILATTVASLIALIFCIITLLGRLNHLYGKALVIIVLIADLLFNSKGLIPTIDAARFDVGTASTTAYDGARLFISSDDEYALKFSRFFRFSDYRPIDPIRNVFDVHLPDTNILTHTALVNNFDPLLPARYVHVLAEVNSLGEAERRQWLEWMHVSTVQINDAQSETGVAFENLSPWGRFRWANCAVFVKDEDEAFSSTKKKLNNRDGQKGVVFLEGNPESPGGHCAEASYARFELIKATSQEIALKIAADRPGYLVVANTYYPDWNISVDGIKTEVYRADYLFFAARIDPGMHEVNINYQPLSFYSGAGISGSMLIIVILSSLLVKRNRITQHNKAVISGD